MSRTIKFEDGSIMQCFTYKLNLNTVDTDNSACNFSKKWIKIPYPVAFPTSCDAVTCSSDYVQLSAQGLNSIAISTNPEGNDPDLEYCYIYPRFNENYFDKEQCTLQIIAVGG